MLLERQRRLKVREMRLSQHTERVCIPTDSTLGVGSEAERAESVGDETEPAYRVCIPTDSTLGVGREG